MFMNILNEFTQSFRFIAYCEQMVTNARTRFAAHLTIVMRIKHCNYTFMHQHTLQKSAIGLGGIALALGLVLSGLMAAPTTADAWWWPWWKYAHAQENASSTVSVTIKKYIDGAPATAASADSLSFPMVASWNGGSGSYSLNADNSYQAKTSEMDKGSDYATSESLDGANVGATCSAGKPFALKGYTTGSSWNAAKAGTPASTSPSFTDLDDDMYVIVWNESCDDDNATTTGDLVGEVTGGSSGGENGELAVTDIEAEKTTAIANGTFTDGWKYRFYITVPSDENDLAMKFEDWLHSNASNTIPVANNMRISSAQASSTSPVVLTAENVYSSPVLTMVNDLDAGEEGIQVEVLVEVAVPAGTLNGTYSTNYGVRSE